MRFIFAFRISSHLKIVLINKLVKSVMCFYRKLLNILTVSFARRTGIVSLRPFRYFGHECPGSFATSAQNERRKYYRFATGRANAFLFTSAATYGPTQSHFQPHQYFKRKGGIGMSTKKSNTTKFAGAGHLSAIAASLC